MTEESIFTAALDRDPAARAAFVAETCGADAGLRQRVEELLASHAAAGSFLIEPAAPGATEMLTGNTDDATRAFSPADPDATLSRAGNLPRVPDDVLTFLKPTTRPDSLGRLAHYEVLSVLGSGGFGTVLKAFDDRLHRVVAVKVLAPQLAASGPARARFLREGRSAAAVRDEHVVNVFAVSDDSEPIPYLVMEFVSGQTLQEKLDKVGPLPAKDVLRIGSQIARGLAAAHATGLIHRDVKPANILLENGVERVKLTDFGLARAADDASISQSGVVAGTPMYMSPEQARGDNFDGRSDLFSLGSVLYSLCAGRPPFRANSTLAVLKRVCEEDPRPVRDVNPEVPVWLADVVAKLHAKDPAGRFQSAKEVADLMGGYLAELLQHGTVISHAPAPVPKPNRRRRKVIAALIAGPLLALAVNAVVLLWIWSAKERHPTGTLVVEGDDSTVEYAVESQQVVHHFTGPQERQLPPGWYTVNARKNGRVLDTKSVSILRDTRTAVRLDTGAVATVVTTTDGFTPLFNGKDLTGWHVSVGEAEAWHVRDGEVVASGKWKSIRTTKATYRDFHFRAEVMINAGGDSGVFFRGPLDVPGEAIQAQILNDAAANGTGSLFRESEGLVKSVPGPPIPPDTWFRFEVVAHGSRVETRVDGHVVAQYEDAKQLPGPIALESFSGETVVHFRKVAVKELPAVETAPPPAVAPFDAAAAKEHQAAWAEHLGVPVEFTNAVGMTFRLIPPGKFTMGTPAADLKRMLAGVPKEMLWLTDLIKLDEPAHPVVIPAPFYLGAFEVTNRQFAAFADRAGYRTADEKSGLGGERFVFAAGVIRKPDFNWKAAAKSNGGQHPVAYMTPPDADAFCEWLTRQEGMAYGLPTEEQWEYACRAGTTGDRFCPDDRLNDFFDFARANKFDLGPVGEKRPNPFGLFDMLGNQNEMARGGGGVVVRGGSSGADPACLDERSASRRYLWGGGKIGAYFQGFRVAITGDLKKAAEIEAKRSAIPKPAVAPFDAAAAKELQEAWAKHLGVPVEFTNAVGMTFRLIPPGEFMMGSTDAEVRDITQKFDVPEWQKVSFQLETPARKVTLTAPAYLAVHECTVGQFRQFVAATKYVTEEEASGRGGWVYDPKTGALARAKENVWRDARFARTEDTPVALVTTLDAEKFCAWLADVEKAGYALPSESLWEFACRAGTTGHWFTGPDPKALAEYAWLTGSGPVHSVGQRKANPFGLFDMLGNVEEIAVAAPGQFFARGQHSGAGPGLVRAAHRGAIFDAYDKRGFRVAITGDLKKVVEAEAKRAAAPKPAAVAPFDSPAARRLQDAAAAALGVKPEITNTVGMKLRLIPPGEFLMGSSPEDIAEAQKELTKHGKTGWFPEFVESRSGPQRAVKLTKPYYVGAHEVTVNDFRQFVKDTGYQTLAEKAGKSSWIKPGWAAVVDPMHPATYLAWDDATAFCDWLSKKEGRAYRLPTEAEWEFACRAGTTTRWWWGDDRAQFLKYAVFSKPLDGGLVKVGEKLPNPFGLYDTHGNAEEWCADWHHPMLTVPPVDPNRQDRRDKSGPDATGRVVRGGFGFDIPELGRSGRRSFCQPQDYTGIAMRFRVALVGDLTAPTPKTVPPKGP